MPDAPHGHPFGPTAVGLLALNDKKFFSDLLAEPEEAMRQAIKDKRLDLSEDDISTVAALIRDRNATLSASDALDKWDRYRRTGSWDLTDWPMGWPWKDRIGK